MTRKRRYLSNTIGYNTIGGGNYENRVQARYGWNKNKSSSVETLANDRRDLAKRAAHAFYYNPYEWRLNKKALQAVDGRYRNNRLDSIADRRYQYYRWLNQQNTKDYINATRGADYYNNAINQARLNYYRAQDAANNAIWMNKEGIVRRAPRRFRRGSGASGSW